MENGVVKQPTTTPPAKEAQKRPVDVWSKQKLFFKKTPQIKSVQFHGTGHKG